MKKYVLYSTLSLYCILMGACHLFEVRKAGNHVVYADSAITIDSGTAQVDSLIIDSVPLQVPPKDATRNRDTVLVPPAKTIDTRNIDPDTVVRFAQTLMGIPYLYASIDPKKGFDCSGFITYVFNHFNIAVPRSSVDFTKVGKTIAVPEAKRGDLILFTGTDSTEKRIGHMGLIVSADTAGLQFIHATSGKAMGVTTTPLNTYYKKRFVRIARIFPQNDLK